MAISTAKFLAPFDPTEPEETPNGFLVPDLEGEQPSLRSIEGGQLWSHGRVVYVGRKLTANDVFARLVDAGRKFDSVADSLAMLDDYLVQISSCKIGDVVKIDRDPQSPFGYALVKGSSS